MSGIEIFLIDFLKLTFLSMVPFVLAGQGTMLAAEQVYSTLPRKASC
jgi:hypothetical protein